MNVAKITALVCGALVTLLFILLLISVTRPVLLTGVSADNLSSSVNGSDSGNSCHKLDSGDWLCQSGAGGRIRVDVNWMGCWTEIQPPGADEMSAPARTGCIQLGDIITFD